MNARTRLLVILLGAVAVGGAVLVRRDARGATGKEVPGESLIGDAALYHALSLQLLFGSLFGKRTLALSAGMTWWR
jgi:hypothetical protein